MSLAEKDTGSANGEVALSRGLGVGAIVFMVVAAAAPLGVVAGNFPVLISLEQSVSAPLFFVLVTALLVLFSVGYTLMSRHVPNAGAFYSYIQAGFGRILGTGAATLALVSYFVLLIGITAYFSVSASHVADQYLNIDLPWWFWMIAGFVVTGWLGYRNIDLSAKVLGVAMVLEALIVVVLDIAILAKGGESGLTGSPFSLSGVNEGAPGLGLMFAFFSFFGFEATAVFRNEAKDPTRTIPRATYIAVISIGLFYAVSIWCVIMGLGVDQAVDKTTADPTGAVLGLAGSYVAPIVQDIMLILLVTSQFACTLSFHNVVTRYQYTMATKRIVPSWLAVVHPKHLTPARSSVVLTAFSLAATIFVAAIGLDPITEVYTWLAGAATLGIILMMAITGVAVIVFFRRTRIEQGMWRTLVAPGLSSLGLFGVVYLVIKYFEMLVGGKAGVAITLAIVLAAAFAIGIIIATVMRARDTASYDRLMDDPDGTAA